MKKLLLSFVVLFVSFSFAQEFPVTQTEPVFFNFDPSQLDREEINTSLSNLPVWTVLERMDLSERNNSLIDVEYIESSSSIETFNQISALWNTGNYEQALDLFKSLTPVELRGVSIGISWKTPIPTNDQTDWGTDVRIGNRDSIEVVSLAYDKTTGNLFAILVLRESGDYFYTVNLSTNTGTTWTETAVYNAGGAFPIVSVSAAAVDSFCYIGYAYDGAQNIGRLRRVRTTTGVFTPFIDGSTFKSVFTLAGTDSVKEVAVCSNQIEFNNRLYYSAITKSDSLKLFWNDEANVVYNSYLNTVTDAEEGLDLTWNTNSTSYFLFGSYVSTTNALKIFSRVSSDSARVIMTYGTGFVNDVSSISAHRDTITTAFEYAGGGNKNQNRYLVSYNGGTTWSFGLVGDSTLISERPDIAAGDGGVGIIYRYYTSTREGRFVWRPMAGTWSTPVKYTDYEPYYNKPAIEYLGNKKFGVVYLSWHNPIERGAYFDLNNMAVGVDDDLAGLPSDFNLSQNYPNPFNPSTLISFQIPAQSNVSIRVYDALGNLIKELVNEEKPSGSYQVEFDANKLASGIYFYRMQAGSFSETKKMILVR